jgi:large subunit ribosomal protein L21
MYAIVDIAGKQFRVEQGAQVKVPLLKAEPGDSVEFDRVLIVGDKDDVKVGTPLVKGAQVSAKIVENGREKRIIVFKKKRRKGYRLTRGHRQHYSRIEIEKIAV